MARQRQPALQDTAATRAQVREVVAAIAADVIAETVQRLTGSSGRREAAPLRIRSGTRSGPRRRRARSKPAASG